MTAIGEVVISTVELLEAEAKRLQVGLRGALLSGVLIAVATLLLVGGLGWLVAAGFLQLRDNLGAVPAAALMGLGSLLVAGGMLWYTSRNR